MSTRKEYDDAVARLQALLDQAIEKGELPPELLPENQHGHVVDPARLKKLREIAVSSDFAALRALSEASSPLTVLNRGEMDESGSDAALEAAKENLRKRRAQGRENDDEESGHDVRN